MKRIIAVSALLASVVVAAAVINKAVNVIGSTAYVHTVCFRRNATGTVIDAEAFGKALSADGGVAEEGGSNWQLGAPARNTVNSFMDNQAVLQWRIDHGLEQ